MSEHMNMWIFKWDICWNKCANKLNPPWREAVKPERSVDQLIWFIRPSNAKVRKNLWFHDSQMWRFAALSLWYLNMTSNWTFYRSNNWFIDRIKCLSKSRASMNNIRILRHKQLHKVQPSRMFYHESVSLFFVDLSAGLKKKHYWMDLYETWMEDGFRPRTEPVNIWFRWE